MHIYIYTVYIYIYSLFIWEPVETTIRELELQLEFPNMMETWCEMVSSLFSLFGDVLICCVIYWRHTYTHTAAHTHCCPHTHLLRNILRSDLI